MDFERPQISITVDGVEYDLNKAKFVVKTGKPGSSETTEAPTQEKDDSPVNPAALTGNIIYYIRKR